MGELNPTLSKNYKFYQYSYQLNLEMDFDEFYNSKNNNKTIQTDNKKLNEGKELLYTYEDCNAQNFFDVEKLIVEKINIGSKN